ncbi:MAG: tetratricopeptide repeat protein, partial [Thermoguttaceae bacterium]
MTSYISSPFLQKKSRSVAGLYGAGFSELKTKARIVCGVSLMLLVLATCFQPFDFLSGVGFSVQTVQAAEAGSDSLAIAKTSYQQGQYAKAITEFKAFLSKYPNHSEKNSAEYFIAESYVQTGDINSAITHLNNILGGQILALLDSPISDFRSDESYRNKFKTAMQIAHTSDFGSEALFRAGEIIFTAKEYELAYKLLFAFIIEFPDDSRNSRTLTYLGETARQNYAVAKQNHDIPAAKECAQEAEWYFNQSVTLYPKGEFYNESLFGYAWSKARLGKYDEATPIFRRLAGDTSRTDLAESANYEWGCMLYEQRNYDEAIARLVFFERMYPQSSLKNDSIRVRAKSEAGLQSYNKSLELVKQIKNPTAEDFLLQVRCYFGLQKIEEAKKLLSDLDQSPQGDAVKDQIKGQKARYYASVNDWKNAVVLLEELLRPKYNTLSKTIDFQYYNPSGTSSVITGLGGLTSGATTTTPTTSSATKSAKLTEENFLRACSLLSLSYANLGEKDKSNAVFVAMNKFADMDDARQTKIIDRTATVLADVASGKGSSGVLGGGSDSIKIPVDAGSEDGIDFGKITVVDKDEIVPVGGSVSPPRPNRGNGSTASTRPGRGPNGSGSSSGSGSGIAGNRPWPGSGNRNPGSSSSGNNSNSDRWGNNNSSGNGSSFGDDLDDGYSAIKNQQAHVRMLRQSRDLVRKREYEKADELLLKLLSSNPLKQTGAEAALLRCEVNLELGNTEEANTMCELILSQYQNTDQYVEALWISAKYYKEEGDVEQALENYRLISNEFPNNKRANGALFYLGWDSMTSNNKFDAKKKFLAVHDDYPTGDYWSHATWALAYLAYESNNDDLAEKYIRELCDHPPDQSIIDRVLYLRGEIAMRKQNWQEAEVSYNMLAKYCKDSPLARDARK